MKFIEGVKFTNYFNDSADVIFAPETCFCETQTLTRQTTLFVKALRSSFFVSALVYMCCCTVCSSNEITQLEDRKRNRRSLTFFPRPEQKKPRTINWNLIFFFREFIYCILPGAYILNTKQFFRLSLPKNVFVFFKEIALRCFKNIVSYKMIMFHVFPNVLEPFTFKVKRSIFTSLKKYLFAITSG